MRQCFYGERERITEAYAKVMEWNGGHGMNESAADGAFDRRCHGEFINESRSKEDESVGDGQLHVFDYGEECPFAERYVVIMPTGEQYDISVGSGGIGWAASYIGDVGYSTRREMEEEALVVDFGGKTYHAAEVEDLSSLPSGMSKRIMELAKDCDDEWGIEGDNENQEMVAKVFGEFNGRIGEATVDEATTPFGIEADSIKAALSDFDYVDVKGDGEDWAIYVKLPVYGALVDRDGYEVEDDAHYERFSANKNKMLRDVYDVLEQEFGLDRRDYGDEFVDTDDEYGVEIYRIVPNSDNVAVKPQRKELIRAGVADSKRLYDRARKILSKSGELSNGRKNMLNSVRSQMDEIPGFIPSHGGYGREDVRKLVVAHKNRAMGESAVNEGAFSRDVEKFDTNCDIIRMDFDVLSDIVKLSDPESGDWIDDYIGHDSYAKIVDVEGINGDIAKIVCLVNEYDDDGTCLVGLVVKNRDDVVGDGEGQYSENEYADLLSRTYAVADDVLADIPGDGEQKPEKFDDYWTGRTKKERKAKKTVGESAVPDFVKLNKITGEDVKDAIDWLKASDEGCYHFKVGDTDKNEIDICIGFHDDGDNEWKIAWKIGMQSPHNAMQTDLDIDFDMPYDGESGDVYDTLTVLEDLDNLDYNAIAAEMNDVAEKVFAYQYDKDDEFVSSFED